MITFSEEPQNPPFDAFNNSVLKYTSNTGAPAVSNITINGTVFDIFPDAEGQFYFNLKRVAQVLINGDHFSDKITPGQADVVINDPALFLDMSAKIDVQLADGSIETVTKAFPFLKSVKQLIRTKYTNSQLRALVPGATDTAAVTYFVGYPFDFALYSDAGRTVTATNKRTGGSTQILLTRGVNRIFVSNGEDATNLEAALPLHLGVNEIEFTSGGLVVTVLINKKEPECGHLLKFLNQSGAWSYWRFNSLFVDQLKTKTRETINDDFENLGDDVGNFQITGKDSQSAREFLSGALDPSEKETVLQLFESPQVYYYVGELSDRFAAKTDFITVEAEGSPKTGNKNYLEEIPARINLPKRYTQTL